MSGSVPVATQISPTGVPVPAYAMNGSGDVLAVTRSADGTGGSAVTLAGGGTVPTGTILMRCVSAAPGGGDDFYFVDQVNLDAGSALGIVHATKSGGTFTSTTYAADPTHALMLDQCTRTVQNSTYVYAGLTGSLLEMVNPSGTPKVIALPAPPLSVDAIAADDQVVAIVAEDATHATLLLRYTIAPGTMEVVVPPGPYAFAYSNRPGGGNAKVFFLAVGDGGTISFSAQRTDGSFVLGQVAPNATTVQELQSATNAFVAGVRVN
jgi:hypothetical protein